MCNHQSRPGLKIYINHTKNRSIHQEADMLNSNLKFLEKVFNHSGWEWHLSNQKELPRSDANRGGIESLGVQLMQEI